MNHVFQKPHGGTSWWIRTPKNVVPYYGYLECAARWPRLTRCLQYVGIASQGEAGVLLRDYRLDMDVSAEVWSHAGIRPVDWIRAALRCRHRVLNNPVYRRDL